MSYQPRNARFRSVLRITGLALAMTVLTAACSLFDSDSSSDDAAAGGGGEITFMTVNFPTLDPQIVTYGMWLAEQGLLEGLVVQNEDGTDVEPATADEWEVSDDLTTYTFHIRDDARWSNGDPVTADDFVWTYKRLLNPSQSGSGTTLGANSYQIGMGIAGAEDYLSGLTQDFGAVGIKAINEDELEFTLEQPNPGFLMGLTHPSMLPMNPTSVEEAGKAWEKPQNWVGNGPFVLTDWRLNSSLRMEPNPEYWDSDNVFLDAVNVQLVEGDATTAGFRNNEVDIQLLGAADVTEFQNDPELSDQLESVPSTTVGYLALLHSQNPALQDPRVREALSLGLDRETIAKVDPNSHSGPSLVPDSVPGYDDSLATPFDPERAKQLLADAGYPNGEGLPEINILSGSEVPILDAIVDQWNEDLGVEAKADVVEVGVYVEKRAQALPSDYAGFYIGYFSGESTMPYFVGTLWGPQFLQETSLPAEVWSEYQKVLLDTKLSAAERTQQLEQIRTANASDITLQFADEVEAAAQATGEEEQTDLYVQAAKTREESYLYIPVVWQDSTYAVRSTLEGVNLRPTLDGFYFKGIKVTSE